MAVKDIVEKAIDGSTVVIFSKSYCSYSKRVKALLAQSFPQVQVKAIELDEIEDGRLIQDYLQETTGQRTVPNVFIKKEHIGGCDDVLKLNSSGKLKSKLA